MLDKETIKEIALANGFKLKPQANGEMDLNPYVYEFANAIAEHCWSAFKSGVMPHKIHPTKASLNNGWISVDDMLPKEFETVLLFGKKYNGEPLITNGHLVQCLVDEFGINDGFSVKMLVTHWQSLPQPPKE